MEIVGLLPFNRDHDRPIPGLPAPVFAGTDGRELDHYRDLLRTTRPDVVLFQHISHRRGVYHARLRGDIPAIGVVHSWQRSGSGRRRRSRGCGRHWRKR